jgi:hypothetical protein
MYCQLQETKIIHHLQGGMDTEARLLLASNVTMPSNSFVFHICVTKDSWGKITLTVLGHNNKPCGPIVDCQEQRQQHCSMRQSPVLAIDCIEQCQDVILPDN